VNDPHFGFIFASYAVTVLVIGGLIVWTILDYRRLRSALARLPRRDGEGEG
jgi:heme exporter protein D